MGLLCAPSRPLQLIRLLGGVRNIPRVVQDTIVAIAFPEAILGAEEAMAVGMYGAHTYTLASLPWRGVRPAIMLIPPWSTWCPC